MGRSTNSCLKIITCGSDSVEQDDLEELNECKGSTDKRRWSFRKRSARHRVLSNTIISEAPSSGNKESPESTSIDFHAQANAIVHEKISTSQWTDETPHLLTAPNPKVSDPLIVSENASKVDTDLEESAVIIIQATVRGLLAQRALLKLKNVVKLQAAVRGHLVRRQAIGTLHCVQAIVKMQALIRGHRARVLVERSVIEDTLDGKLEKNNQNLKPLGKENSRTATNKTYSSTEKLLSNGFARQLLESMPKTKSIHIKCDLSRPDSGWKWLERWTSVPSTDSALPHKPLLCPGYQEKGEKTETVVSEIFTEIPAEVISESADLKSSIRETSILEEDEDNLITYNADSFEFQACHPITSIRDDLDQPQLENVDMSKAQETSLNMDLLLNQTEMQPVATSQKVLDSVSDKAEMDNEQAKDAMKRVPSEQLETENKKFAFGSRTVCNQAFVAAQSKFEELSSLATSGRSTSSTYRDVGVQSKVNTLSSPADSITRAREHSLTENLVSHEPRIQVGGSECGTELSITSTLDSPDASEVEGGEFEDKGKVVEKGACELNCTSDNASNLGNQAFETINVSSMPLPNLSCPISVQPEALEDGNGESAISVVVLDSLPVELQPERSTSDVPIQLYNAMDQQAYRSSPEGSTRSNITGPESHGTPSSQVSRKAKRNKLDKSGSTQKRKSLSTANKSPSNLNHDSGARSSTEQLPKDPKNGKRRKSFGSSRPDYVDQEPRDGSSNSLPSYMQATESAKAKAHANNSPRSSPDVQDKDIYIKKRQSFPGANGKQGSPRIQQSQVQQGAKGSGTHSHHENKWQR